MASMQIAFVTTEPGATVEGDPDRPLHERAFAEAGLALVQHNWWDERVDWSEFDLVVIRSPWDYTTRRAEFLRWLDRVAVLPTLHNPGTVIRWNLDKHYVRDLAQRGVRVVPTRYLDSERALADALESAAGEFVLKPVVSAGSRNTGRFAAGDAGALALGRLILAEGLEVMLQPCIASVGRRGEVSLVLFDGEFSHAFRKGPLLALGGGLLGGNYSEKISPAEAGADQLELARSAAAATRDLLGLEAPLLYARYDLVELDDGRQALLEAELFEPCFFLSVDADAPARFAAAVASRVRGSR